MTTPTAHRQADTLPARHRRTMRRLHRTERAKVDAILRRPAAGYMDDRAFHEPDAVRRLFDEAAELPTPNCDWYHPGVDAEVDLRQPPASANTLLSAAQEKAIFLQFNFARFRAAALHRQLNDDGFEDGPAAALLYWDEQAARLRDRIVEFNLALVLAMARHVSAARLDFSELLSEGNMALLRAVDKFDVSRAFKFSTYACRAILKAYSRMSVKRSRMRGLFPAGFDPALEQPEQGRRAGETLAEYTSELRRALDSNEAALTQIERQVIECRFPMEDDRSTDRPTLQEVGQMVGYSKERVRQIQKQALDKLRGHMESKFQEMPFERAGS
jgi:RNA polymerase sigma factor (sigma-70 family)